MDCSPPGSSVHGVPQARVLEYSFSPPGGLPDPGIEPVFLLAGEFFTAELSGNPKGMYWVGQKVRTLMNFLANPIYKTLGVVADLSVCIQPSWLS